MNPSLSTLGLELELVRALLCSFRGDGTVSFPKTGLQIGDPTAKSGPQMCFAWPTQCFLKIRKFYIIIYISGLAGKLGRSSDPESQHGDARLLLRSSRPLLPPAPRRRSLHPLSSSVFLPRGVGPEDWPMLGYTGPSHTLQNV